MLEIGDIAKTCHEVNRAYCKSIGDNSIPSWEDAPEWMQQSAYNIVCSIIDVQDNANFTPEDSHNNWMKDRINNGWKWGTVKDVEKKEHPCLVPYKDLPAEQKTKDYLFISVVLSLQNLL